jgi:hypothetical protein
MPDYVEYDGPFAMTPNPASCRITQKSLVRSSWALSMVMVLLTVPFTNGIQGIGQLVKMKDKNSGFLLSFGSALNLRQIYTAAKLPPFKIGLSYVSCVNVMMHIGPLVGTQTGTMSALRGGFTPKRGKKSKSKRKPLSLKYKIQKRILSVSNSHSLPLLIFISVLFLGASMPSKNRLH